ncbi:TetR/AcrR family transcriptional regulator [Deinococcota bacterium DY0809b]
MQGLRERQKQRRRERILRTAVELFKERGFQQTTAVDIAKASHVSRGTFFNYYPYKEAVLLDYGAELLTLAWSEAKAALENGVPPVEVLEAFWNRLAELSEQELGRELLSHLAYELVNPDPERAHAAYEALPLAQFVAEILRPLARAGRLRTDLSLDRMANSIADAFLLAVLRWAGHTPDRSLAGELQKFLTIVLEGVLARP